MIDILDTPDSAQKKLDYAGFWIRVAATIIDSIIIYAALFVVGYFFVEELSPDNIILTLFSAYVILPIIVAIYYASFESSSKQATPGKMAVGIKVGNHLGKQLTFGNAIGRYFAKILSAMILYIGFMMAGWDDKKQGLHDKIAGTYVFYAQ